MSKEIPIHKDILDRTIVVGDHVAYADSNMLRMGKVDKINPKMIKIQKANSQYSVNKYPRDVVKLEGPDLVMYLLKK
jgi:hypothetical protein